MMGHTKPDDLNSEKTVSSHLPENQAELVKSRVEQSILRYRLLLQRGMAWSHPKKEQKQHQR